MDRDFIYQVEQLPEWYNAKKLNSTPTIPLSKTRKNNNSTLSSTKLYGTQLELILIITDQLLFKTLLTIQNQADTRLMYSMGILQYTTIRSPEVPTI